MGGFLVGVESTPYSLVATSVFSSVADPQDLYVLGDPGSGPGSISKRYGSFYNQAKIVRKTLIPTVS